MDSEIVTLSNGTLKNTRTGRFISGPAKPMITKDNARDMAGKALEARRRKARAELVAAAELHSGRTGLKPSDAYAVIAGEFTRSALANAMDKPRDSVPAAKLALHMADMAPAEDRQRVPLVAIQINHIGADVAQLADDASVPDWEE